MKFHVQVKMINAWINEQDAYELEGKGKMKVLKDLGEGCHSAFGQY